MVASAAAPALQPKSSHLSIIKTKLAIELSTQRKEREREQAPTIPIDLKETQRNGFFSSLSLSLLLLSLAVSTSLPEDAQGAES
jgi:hypothetical protein